MATSMEEMIVKFFKLKDELKELAEDSETAKRRDLGYLSVFLYGYTDRRSYYDGWPIIQQNIENQSKEKIDEQKAIIKTVFQKDLSHLLLSPILDIVGDYSLHMDFSRQESSKVSNKSG